MCSDDHERALTPHERVDVDHGAHGARSRRLTRTCNTGRAPSLHLHVAMVRYRHPPRNVLTAWLDLFLLNLAWSGASKAELDKLDPICACAHHVRKSTPSRLGSPNIG